MSDIKLDDLIQKDKDKKKQKFAKGAKPLKKGPPGAKGVEPF